MHSTVTEAANFVLKRIEVGKQRAEEAMKAACTELGVETPPVLSCYVHADGSFKIGLSRKNGGKHFIPHDFETEQAYLVPWMKESPHSHYEILEHWSERHLKGGKWVNENERLPKELVGFLNCLLRLGFGFTINPTQYGGLAPLSESGERIEVDGTGYGYIRFSPFPS